MLNTEEVRRAIKYLLPDVVDETLFALLDAMDNDELDLVIASTSGSSVALTAKGMGELAGWLMERLAEPILSGASF